MKRVQIGISVLALMAMTAEASAATVCDKGAAAALKTAAVQQELMVAGLTCRAGAAYNRFVLADRLQLQQSDADLMTYFKNRDGNEAGYDSYKTKLANLAANKSSAPGNSFCNATARAFQASQNVPLEDFIAGQRLLIAAPEACAVQYDRVEEAAVTGPSYSLPAAPYGAPAAPPQAFAQTRRYEDPNARQDYEAPAPRYANANANQRQAYVPPRRQQQDYYNQGWDYDPYGWVPPRPPRRGGWYQSGYGYDD